MNRKTIFGNSAILACCLFSGTLFAQDTRISWSAFDMGYAIRTDSKFSVTSAVGQVFVGTSQQGGSSVGSGFLSDTLFAGFLLGVRDAGERRPLTYALEQNYPNPFNPATTIEYRLPYASKVILKVYDVLGREVVTLVDKNQDAGTKTAQLHAGNLASGVYMYRLEAYGLSGEKNPFTSVKRMLLVK